jgi:hypothetical protein
MNHNDIRTADREQAAQNLQNIAERMAAGVRFFSEMNIERVM